MHSADRILPALQRPAIGDPRPLSATGGQIFKTIQPYVNLVWSGASGRFSDAFTWALYPLNATHATREPDSVESSLDAAHRAGD